MIQALLPAAIKFIAPYLASYAVSGVMDSLSGSRKKPSRRTATPTTTRGVMTPTAAQASPVSSGRLVGSKVNRVTPPAFTQPLLDRAASEANRLYESGRGFQPYPYERVAPLSDQTRWNINNLGTISTAMQNPYTQSLMSAPLQSISNLSEMASGSQIGKNPYFQDVLQNALGLAATNINERMSAAGRYGSGAHTETLANTLGNIATRAMSDQYNTDVGRMLAANELMQRGQLGQMQAIGQLGSAQSGVGVNALRASDVLDQYNQDLIEAQRERWAEEQAADWNRLGTYANLGKLLSGDYKTTTQDEYKNEALIESLGKWANLGLKLGEAEPWNTDLAKKLGSFISDKISGLGSGGGRYYSTKGGTRIALPSAKDIYRRSRLS